jgi:hypothetical protein
MSLTATANGYVQYISIISDPVRVVRPNISIETMSDGMGTTTRTVTFWDSIMGNATTIARGLAMADSYIVGWQEKELFLFPTDYASSLAQKAGISWGSSTPAPASTSNLPRETSSVTPSPPTADDLSTGHKVGISVGAAAALLIGAPIVAWICLSRRKRKKKQSKVVRD